MTAPDDATVLRALLRLVHTDKLLSFDEAQRLCDVFGIPREKLHDAGA